MQLTKRQYTESEKQLQNNIINCLKNIDYITNNLDIGRILNHD